MGAYDQVGHQLLGATCSAPIRVLANNDVPSGAAFIQLHLPIRAAWEGWQPHAMKVGGFLPGSPAVCSGARCAPASCSGLFSCTSSVRRKRWLSHSAT